MITKHPKIYEDENCFLTIEMCEDKPFIHCTVHNWNHNIYKDLIKSWEEITHIFNQKGYTKIYASDMDDKVRKFAKKFGFKEGDFSTLGEDGKIRRALICQTQSQQRY